MINKRVQDVINDQINAEFYSAFLYLSMSAYFEGIDLPGFANWMKIQFQEEQAHAMGMFDFVNERGGRVELNTIEKPDFEWKNSIEVFEATLAHEEHVTGLINNLMSVALEEKDYASSNFINWYIKEQVEEESNVNNLLNQLKLVNGEGQALLMLDRELAQRTFVAPVIG